MRAPHVLDWPTMRRLAPLVELVLPLTTNDNDILRYAVQLRLAALQRLGVLLNGEQVARQEKVNLMRKQMERMRRQKLRELRRAAGSTATLTRTEWETKAMQQLLDDESDEPTQLDQLTAAVFAWHDAHLPLSITLDLIQYDSKNRDLLLDLCEPSPRTCFHEGELPDLVDDIERLIVRSMCESIYTSNGNRNKAASSSASSTSAAVAAMRRIIDKCLPQRCHVREVASAVEAELGNDVSDALCALMGATLLGVYEHARQRPTHTLVRKQLFALFVYEMPELLKKYTRTAGAWFALTGHKTWSDDASATRLQMLRDWLRTTIQAQSRLSNSAAAKAQRKKPRNSSMPPASAATFQSVLFTVVRELVVRSLRQRPGSRVAIIRSAPTWLSWERAIYRCTNEMRGALNVNTSDAYEELRAFFPDAIALVVAVPVRLPENSLVPLPLEPFCEALVRTFDTHLDNGFADSRACHALLTPECRALMRIVATALPLRRGNEMMPLIVADDTAADELEATDESMLGLSDHVRQRSMLAKMDTSKENDEYKHWVRRLLRWPLELARMRARRPASTIQCTVSADLTAPEACRLAVAHQFFPLYVFGAHEALLRDYGDTRERYLVAQSSSAAKKLLAQFIDRVAAFDASGYQYQLMYAFCKLASEWSSIYVMRLPEHIAAQQRSMLAASLNLPPDGIVHLPVEDVRGRLLKSFVCSQCERFCGFLHRPIVPAFANSASSVAAQQKVTLAARMRVVTLAAVQSAASAAAAASSSPLALLVAHTATPGSTAASAAASAASASVAATGSGAKEIRIVWSTPLSRLLGFLKTTPVISLWQEAPARITSVADAFRYWRHVIDAGNSGATSAKYASQKWSLVEADQLMDAPLSLTSTIRRATYQPLAAAGDGGGEMPCALRARDATRAYVDAVTCRATTTLAEVRTALSNAAIMNEWIAINATRTPVFAQYRTMNPKKLATAAAASLTPDWPPRAQCARWVCSSRASKMHANKGKGVPTAAVDEEDEDEDEDDESEEDENDVDTTTTSAMGSAVPPVIGFERRQVDSVLSQQATTTMDMSVNEAITERELATALSNVDKRRRRQARRSAASAECARTDLYSVDLLGYALVIRRSVILSCARCLAFVDASVAQWRGPHLECGACRRATTQLIAGLGATAHDALAIVGRRAHGAARTPRLTSIESIALSKPRCTHCLAISVVTFNAIDDVSGRILVVGACESDAWRAKPFLVATTLPLMSVIEQAVVVKGRTRESNTVASTSAALKRALPSTAATTAPKKRGRKPKLTIVEVEVEDESENSDVDEEDDDEDDLEAAFKIAMNNKF